MKSSLSVSIKYGVLIALALIIYFLALKLIGLYTNPWFRVLNGLIMAFGIYWAIKNFKSSNNTFGYGSGVKTGLLTGFIATGIFTAFMALYLFHLDTEFTQTIANEWLQNFEESGGIMIMILVLEGSASTAVLTLAFMQIFKKSQNMGQQENLVEHKKEDDFSNT